MATSCSFKKLSDIILIYFDVISAAVPSLSSRRLDDPSKPRTGCVNSVAVTGSHHAAALRHGIAWCNWRSLNFVDCMTLPEYARVESKSDLICHDLWADVEQLNIAQQWKSKGVRSTSIWITDHHGSKSKPSQAWRVASSWSFNSFSASCSQQWHAG